MKVTIEISDVVLEEAKDFALREGITVDALAEDGMRRILNDQREGAAPVSSDTLQEDAPAPAFRDNWDHVGAAFGDTDA